MRALILATVLVSAVAWAEDISPEKMAKVRMEKKQATDAVEKKYAGKKLSTADRKAMEQEKNEAAMKVLEKNGVDAKSFARTEATMSKDDRAAADSAQKGMEKKAADDAKAAEAKKAEDGKSKEIVIEKGNGSGSGGGKGKGKSKYGDLPPGYGPPPEANAAPGTPEGDAAEAAAADRAAGIKK
jgi:hypothetical protein